MSTFSRPGRWLGQAYRDHRLPLLLLLAPIGVVVWGTTLENAPILFVLPVSAFVIGFALTPRHAWIMWLGAVVIQWIAMGIFGKYADPEGETVASLILEAFAWMALGVFLPVWLGRTMRRALAPGGRRGDGPPAPAVKA